MGDVKLHEMGFVKKVIKRKNLRRTSDEKSAHFHAYSKYLKYFHVR